MLLKTHQFLNFGNSIHGIHAIGIGTDLCQDQPDEVVEWMRVGRWTREIDYGEGSSGNPGFPEMPSWFHDNTDFANIESGLKVAGFDAAGVAGIMGGNWLQFYDRSFGPQNAGKSSDQKETVK